mmetsp:Transcript_7022/g.19317  ORF Transcript_7022/g.19317 Transcript_7022/m.19317 type:complete len:160 (-) Transcript_7022:32-511(-)
MHAGRYLGAAVVGGVAGVVVERQFANLWQGPSVLCQDSQGHDFSVLQRLWQTIEARRDAKGTTSSWTAKLLAMGPDKCCQKVGEEATEVVIEAAARRRDGVVTESADLLYHLFVLWASLGLTPNDVLSELARREDTSGMAEKESRPAAAKWREPASRTE